MSISAISSASSYLTQSSSNNSEYEIIKQKLKALGLVASGNMAVDKLTLQQAEKSQDSSKVQSASQSSSGAQSSSSGSSQAIPSEWKNLLAELGLTTSGDINTDYQNAIGVIKEKLSSTSSESEKTEYRGLQAQMDKFVSSNQSSTASAASAMLGATALAQMNKSFLLNQNT